MAFYRKFDLSAMNGIEEILVKQQDANSRTINFELEDEGVPFDLSGKIVTFFAKRKCDGRVFAKECTTNSNSATVILSGNMLSENDILMCELTLIGENYTISTPTFTVNVARLVRDDDYIEGTDEFSAFENAMQNAMNLPDAEAVNKAVERLEAALEALDSNALPDDSVGISMTRFFDYDFFVSSSNVFNGEFFRDTILSAASGFTSSGSTYSTSDYIEVKPATAYIISRTDLNHFENTIVICWYSAGKTFLSSQAVYNSPENRIINSPDTAEYMRFSICTNELDGSEHIVVIGIESDAVVSDDYIPEYEEYTQERIATITDPELLAMFEERDNCSVAAANDYTDLCLSMDIDGEKIADKTITASKLADGSITADKLADGLSTKGDDGVGVEAVAQTYTSYDDDGENIVTLYLTDGKSFSFKIKNGSKGSDGKKGETGAAGEDGVGITGAVVNTNGEFEITYSNGITDNFGSIKGQDGKDGIGISDITISDEGYLIITLTDGTEKLFADIKGTDELDYAGVVGYVDTDNTIVLDNIKDGTYIIKFEDWTTVIDEYDSTSITVTDAEKEYNDLIPENCSPIAAKRLGVYDADGNKVGNIRLTGGYRPNKLGAKLYSFGALSDVHFQYETAAEDLKKALTYLNETEDVEFTCICGDLTEYGTENNLAEYKSYVDTYSADTPVYAITGNHEGYNSSIESIIEDYTGNPLYYSFTQNNDVFIMLGIKSDYSGSLFAEGELQWLYETLEANRNKRCFVFQHVRPQDGCGNAFGIYAYDIWGGTEATVFESLMKHYHNVILFHGHSHLKFYLQYGSDIANYDNQFGCHSVHIPSLAAPRDGDASGASSMKQIYAESEGYVVDVYKNNVVLRGRDFANECFLPIAQYCLDTALKTIEAGTYVDSTGTIDTGVEVPDDTHTVRNLVPTSTDTDGSVYNGIGYKNNIYLSSSDGTAKDKDGVFATGFMELSNTFYVSGATWNATSSDCRIISYGSTKAYSNYITGTTNTDGFEVTDMGNGWTKFVIPWTQYSYIRLCFTGTGESLVVTNDVPPVSD